MEKAIFRRVRYALMRYLEERMLTQEREREKSLRDLSEWSDP